MNYLHRVVRNVCGWQNYVVFVVDEKFKLNMPNLCKIKFYALAWG